MSGDGLMTIGELSRRSGTPVKALRAWTDMGLVYSAGRSPAGYRLFDDSALWCTAVIGELRGLGMTLAEIRELAGVYLGQPTEPVGPHVAGLLRRARDRADAQITRLQELRQHIDQVLAERAAELAGEAIGVGLRHVEATVSSMLDGTEACFVVAFGAIIARRSPGSRAVTGVLLSAAGVAVLGGTHSLLGIGPWNLVVLGGVACAGLCNVLTDRVLSDDVDPLTMTAYQMGFAALCALPLLVWQWQSGGGIGGSAARPADWAVAMASGIALAAGFLLYNYAIVRVPVTTAGMILNTLPVFGVAAAIAFLGERITWAQVAGAVVILIAFFLFEETGDQAEETRVPRPVPQAQHSPVPVIPALVAGD